MHDPSTKYMKYVHLFGNHWVAKSLYDKEYAPYLNKKKKQKNIDNKWKKVVGNKPKKWFDWLTL